MADPCDPLGAGVVPPGKHLIFGLQLCPGLIQLFCQFPGKTIRRQLNGLPLRQRFQTVCYSLQPLCPRQLNQKQRTRPSSSIPSAAAGSTRTMLRAKSGEL